MHLGKRKPIVRIACPCSESVRRLKHALEEAGWRVQTLLDGETDNSQAEVLLGDWLTSRETEVLQAIANEGGVRSAAKALCLEENTVHKHLKRIHARTGSHSTLASVVWAIRKGLIR